MLKSVVEHITTTIFPTLSSEYQKQEWAVPQRNLHRRAKGMV